MFGVNLVGKIGIEPIRVLPRRILSPVRLPVPPLSHARNILTFFLTKVNSKIKKSYRNFNFLNLQDNICNF